MFFAKYTFIWLTFGIADIHSFLYKSWSKLQSLVLRKLMPPTVYIYAKDGVYQVFSTQLRCTRGAERTESISQGRDPHAPLLTWLTGSDSRVDYAHVRAYIYDIPDRSSV